jgi:hypothetical protein
MRRKDWENLRFLVVNLNNFLDELKFNRIVGIGSFYDFDSLDVI